MTAKAQTRASNKYNAANYDRLAVQVPKGKREELKQMAKEKGYAGLNTYICHLLEKDTGIDLNTGLD